MNRTEIFILLLTFSFLNMGNTQDVVADSMESSAELPDQEPSDEQKLQLNNLLNKNLNQLQPPKFSGEVESEDPEENFEYNPWEHNYYEQYPDGTYVYGYTLPHGVRRYERCFRAPDPEDGLIVEGFYTQERHLGHRLMYELRCYRSDKQGYRPLKVEYLRRAPRVERDVEPSVDCFN